MASRFGPAVSGHLYEDNQSRKDKQKIRAAFFPAMYFSTYLFACAPCANSHVQCTYIRTYIASGVECVLVHT